MGEGHRQSHSKNNQMKKLNGRGWKKGEEEAGDWQEEVGGGEQLHGQRGSTGTNGPCQGGAGRPGMQLTLMSQPGPARAEQQSGGRGSPGPRSSLTAGAMPGRLLWAVIPGKSVKTLNRREGAACMAEQAVGPNT